MSSPGIEGISGVFDIIVVGLLCGLLVGLAVTASAHWIGRRFKLLDHPDGGRKRHKTSTPLVGGIGLYGGLTIGIVICSLSFDHMDRLLFIIFAITTAFFITGLMDDRKPLGAWLRLGIGIGALALAFVIAPELRLETLWFSGTRISLELGWFALPFTVFCILCLKHGANMMDGLNGLFLGTAAIWMILLLPWLSPQSVVLLAGVGGALFVLLIANLQGRLFTGDSGTNMMSALIGLVAVDAYVQQDGALSAAYLASCFLIPVLDMGRLMIYRQLKGRRAFAPDRNHFHHYLHRKLQNSNLAVAVYLTLNALPALHTYLGVPLPVAIVLQCAGYVMALHWCATTAPAENSIPKTAPEKG